MGAMQAWVRAMRTQTWHMDSDARQGMTRGLYSTRPAAPADESNIPPRGRARAEYSKP